MNFAPRLPQANTRVVLRHRTRWDAFRLLARNRYQLTGAILVAALAPALIHRELELFSPYFNSASNSAAAAFLAILGGAFILRHVSAYPGVQQFAYVLPTFVALYGALLLAFLFLRLDYSRMQLLVSFAATLGWFYFVINIERYVRRPNLLVLPQGDAPTLVSLRQADWRLARSTEAVPDDVTGVVADLRATFDEEWERFLARCALSGLPVYHSKQVSESLTGRVEIETLSENNLGALLPSSVYMRFKRLGDIAGVLVAAPFAAMLATIVTAVIWFTDGGPVLYRQTRMGFRGKTFVMLKFRTMRAGRGHAGKQYTDENDPRITGVGRLLRRYRIDELPQIVNIARGEMSWIGPRPESLPLAEWYERRIPFYSYRHIVRPGLTGWAQVNQGNVAEVEAARKKLHFDFFYIKYFSPWLELFILAKTVRTVLTGSGAR